jgi:hypothetical protein
MLNPENQHDKDRFQALKGNEEKRGRDDESATQIAAREVKELRKREGKSKDDEAQAS